MRPEDGKDGEGEARTRLDESPGDLCGRSHNVLPRHGFRFFLNHSEMMSISGRPDRRSV